MDGVQRLIPAILHLRTRCGGAAVREFESFRKNQACTVTADFGTRILSVGSGSAASTNTFLLTHLTKKCGLTRSRNSVDHSLPKERHCHILSDIEPAG